MGMKRFDCENFYKAGRCEQIKSEISPKLLRKICVMAYVKANSNP